MATEVKQRDEAWLMTANAAEVAHALCGGQLDEILGRLRSRDNGECRSPREISPASTKSTRPAARPLFGRLRGNDARYRQLLSRLAVG